MKIRKLVVRSSRDFLNILDKYNHSKVDIIFRGVKDLSFELSPSIERKLEISEINSTGYAGLERQAIENFSKISHHYKEDSEFNQQSLFEIWSLFQHYGAYSRLLDFSHSLPVGLFFSIWELDKKGIPCIWCINIKKLKDKANAILVENYATLSQYANHDYSRNPYTGRNWIDEKIVATDPNAIALANSLLRFSLNSFSPQEPAQLPIVVQMEPPRKNKRLFMQNGCFLLPLNSQATFMRNFAGMFNETEIVEYENVELKDENIQETLNNEVIFVITLNECKRQDLTFLISSLNVRSETLFPDFMGMMQGLGRKGPIPKDLR